MNSLRFTFLRIIRLALRKFSSQAKSKILSLPLSPGANLVTFRVLLSLRGKTLERLQKEPEPKKMPEPSSVEMVGIQFLEFSSGEGRKSGDIRKWIFGESSSFHGIWVPPAVVPYTFLIELLEMLGRGMFVPTMGSSIPILCSECAVFFSAPDA
jgi:hypothetical protein